MLTLLLSCEVFSVYASGSGHLNNYSQSLRFYFFIKLSYLRVLILLSGIPVCVERDSSRLMVIALANILEIYICFSLYSDNLVCSHSAMF